MAELKNRLRAGDVWVDGSRRYRSLDDDLLPLDRAREQLATADPVMHDPAAFLRDRKQQLAAALVEVERQAAADQLPDAGIRNGRLAVAQLQASTPKEVTALCELLYGVLPRIRITDLLEEVDRWTGFAGCFTHLKTGLPSGDGRTLLTALLADGINMGLKRMAEACPGASFWQFARVVDWHVRDETYVQATARLVDAQRALPIAARWGDGTMSSSDGQFFQAGGQGLAPSAINARYGSEPGVSFYSHLSDQFGAFYSKVIAATAHEAPHILDGLLLHESGLRIEQHTTDTGGFTVMWTVQGPGPRRRAVVPGVHGRDPRRERARSKRAGERTAREGPVGPRGNQGLSRHRLLPRAARRARPAGAQAGRRCIGAAQPLWASSAPARP